MTIDASNDTPTTPPVRTRFAPSPTGFMHIGGMRTALFAWLLARSTGGQFILRVDDTDKSRNVDDALAPILDAFAWLGLDWDEGPESLVQGRPVGGGEHGPYFQSQRGEFYTEAIDRLLGEGKAYRDYEPPDDTRAQREAAEREKRNYVSSRVSLDTMTSEQREAQKDQPHVVRLVVPRDESVTITDAVRGEVTWQCADMVDPVLARADGSPLYNLASVVDDGRMGITHIVRAEEHLSNVPIQALLFDALGYARPQFAHIPFVTAPGTSKKLSKREKDLAKYRTNPQFKSLYQLADRVLPQLGLELDATMNPVMVRFYQEVGFLPEAVLNTLARLGWSLDDKTEVLSLGDVVKHFTLDRVVKAPAGLDADKLLSFQEHWMGQRSVEERTDLAMPMVERAGLTASREHVAAVVDALGDRFKLASDILNFEEFFVADEAMEYDAKAFKKRLQKDPAAVGHLTAYRDELAGLSDWTVDGLQALTDRFCEAREIGLGKIVHAIRVSTTGKAAGAGIFDTLAVIGRDSVLARIDRTLDRLATVEA